MDEIENAWNYLNNYISSKYNNCSSLAELIDGFGVRNDGEKKKLWEVIKDALDAYDDEIGRIYHDSELEKLNMPSVCDHYFAVAYSDTGEYYHKPCEFCGAVKAH